MYKRKHFISAGNSKSKVLFTINELEEKIIYNIALGFGNRVIGLTLHLSVRTIENHVEELLDKVFPRLKKDDPNRSRLQLVSWALENKILCLVNGVYSLVSPSDQAS